MSYCLNPSCNNPQNAENAEFCLSCGQKLLLDQRYRAVKLIGQGGFGKTFLAIDENKQSRPPCAIKQFFPRSIGAVNQSKTRALFEQEAIQLKRLGKNPQIPQFYDFLEQNDCQFLIQEWIAGENLAQILQREGCFSEDQLHQLLRDLLPALQFLHDNQIIHRDIKPANLIYRSDGTLVLVDFGAAKTATDYALHQTGTIIGSPEYIAPEQLQGKAHFTSDIYSVGVTCIHLLTDISPFELFSVSQDAWVWRDFLAQSPVTPKLSAILDRMIEKAVIRRYQSVEEILIELGVAEFIPASLGIIDPEPLKNLLQQHNWKAANQETEKLLLQLGKQERQGWLESRDVEIIPCSDLKIIDELWREHSQGAFGFSVQREIWEQLNSKKYQPFGQVVGWYNNGEWLRKKDINFSLDAPKGHLPVMSWWFGQAIWGLKGFFARLKGCNL